MTEREIEGYLDAILEQINGSMPLPDDQELSEEEKEIKADFSSRRKKALEQYHKKAFKEIDSVDPGRPMMNPWEFLIHIDKMDPGSDVCWDLRREWRVLDLWLQYQESTELRKSQLLESDTSSDDDEHTGDLLQNRETEELHESVLPESDISSDDYEHMGELLQDQGLQFLMSDMDLDDPEHVRDLLLRYREGFLCREDCTRYIWQKPVWAECILDKNGFDDRAVRSIERHLGEDCVDNDGIHMPVLLRNEKAGFFLYGDKEDVVEMSHHLIRAFLSNLPSDSLRICVYDPEERGQSIRPFLDMKKRVDGLVRICSRPDEIRLILNELDERMQDRIENKLSSEYEDIFEYNENSKNKGEAIDLVILYDFPEQFAKDSVNLLYGVLRNGPRCGIFIVLCFDEGKVSSGYNCIEEESIQKLRSVCNEVECKENGILLEGSYSLALWHTPGKEEMRAYTDQYLLARDRLLSDALRFDRTCEPEDGRWYREDSTDGLRIPIGMEDGSETVELKIGSVSNHGLIIGPSGSGKSVLLNTIILSSLIHYSPEELQLYLIDFKNGMEFNIYSANVAIPHISLIALETVQLFGESILEEICEESKRRAERFKSVGAKDFCEYRRKSGEKLPRILVIIDEFAQLYKRDKDSRIADHCSKMTRDLLSQGRASGIHLLMASQDLNLDGAIGSNELLSNANLRIGLNWNDRDTLPLFGKDDRDLEKLKSSVFAGGRKGGAVILENKGAAEPRSIRVALCKDPESYLGQISGHNTSGKKPRVFSSNQEYPLWDRLQAIHMNGTGISLFLGEPIRIADPVCVDLDHDNSNLMICGEDKELEDRISENCLVCALACERSSVYCVDGKLLGGYADENTEEFYRLLNETGRFHLLGSEEQLRAGIEEIYVRYNERKDSKVTHDPILFFVRNIHLIQMIREILSERDAGFAGRSTAGSRIASIFEDDDMDGTASSDPGHTTGEMLRELLRDGGSFGTYCIVSSSDPGAIRDLDAEFRNKLLFALSESKAYDIAKRELKTENLIRHAAFFLDRQDGVSQIKPYKELSLEELKDFVDDLRKVR